MKRIRAILESIAFAGMKPGAKSGASKNKQPGPLGGSIDRFLSGSAPSDPLYLTNRRLHQKMRSWILIGAPCLILAAGIGLALSSLIDPPKAKEITEPTPKEVAEKILPNLSPDLKVEQNKDVEVVEVRIDHTGDLRLVGVVRNTTNHDIAAVRMVVQLTDVESSQVGFTEARVENIPASKTKAFTTPIVQKTAMFALVREIFTGK
jgi:hypothetical protein